jgi:hypothetical protein
VLDILTTEAGVVILSNMNAELLLNERRILSESVFVEMVVWHLPRSHKNSARTVKYRLALVVEGLCVLRYDNEAGKGDHKHVGNEEMDYAFTTIEVLLDDFWKDVDNWRY